MKFILVLGLIFSGCGPRSAASLSCVESFTVDVATDLITLDNSNTEIAQSFTSSTGGSPAKVQLKLNAVGAPTGNLILKLESDFKGAPDSVPLAVATLDAATVKATGADFYTFTFPAPNYPVLTKTTVYWLRLKGQSLTPTNSTQWNGNNTNAYPNGNASIFTSGTWSTGLTGPNRDLLFKVGC